MQNTFTTKRIIIGLGSLIVLFFAVGAIWYFLLRADGTGGNSDGGGFLSNLFPNSEEKKLTEEEENQIEEGQENGSIPENLNASRGDSYQLVDSPVAGAAFYKGKIRYLDRGTGNFMEVDLDGKNRKPLSSNIFSGAFNAIFSAQGNKAIVKYSSGDRATILIASLSGSSTVQTTILPPGTKDAVFSSRGDRIVYVLPAGDDASVITATTDNKSQTVRLKMKYSDWRIFWPEEGAIYLQSGPSAYLGGFLYKLTLAGNTFTKIFGPMSGFTANVANSNIIFSNTDSDNNSINTSISNSAGGNVGPMIVRTLPEKCIWSKKVKEVVFCAVPLPIPQGVYPDDWYKGKISFGDTIVKINIKSRAVNSLLLPETLDATKMFLSEDETTLFFVNKIDESLWRLKLP